MDRKSEETESETTLRVNHLIDLYVRRGHLTDEDILRSNDYQPPSYSQIAASTSNTTQYHHRPEDAVDHVTTGSDMATAKQQTTELSQAHDQESTADIITKDQLNEKVDI